MCHSFHLWTVLIYENSGRGSAESWTWGGKTQAPVQAGTTVKQLGKKRTWGFGIWTKLNRSHQPVLLWQRQQTASWAAETVRAAGWGRWCCLCTALLRPHPAAVPGPAPLGWAGRKQLSPQETVYSEGLSLLDGAEKEAKRHKRGHNLQEWNDKALLIAKRLKTSPSTQKKKQSMFWLKGMFWKESSSVMQNQMTFCYHFGQLLWAASKTTLMKECVQGKCLEQEPCSAPLATSTPSTRCSSMRQQEGAGARWGIWSSGGEAHYHVKAEEWPN